MEDSPVSHIARLSVSLPAELLERLDMMVGERGLPSRSQMIAELIRHELSDHHRERRGGVLAGTITLVYRADSGRVRHAVASAQLAYVKEVISAQNVFLEDDQCMEVLLVQGPTARLQSLCDELRRVRGVQQITLVTTTALLPPLHAHGAAQDMASDEKIAG